MTLDLGVLKEATAMLNHLLAHSLPDWVPNDFRVLHALFGSFKAEAGQDSS